VSDKKAKYDVDRNKNCMQLQIDYLEQEGENSKAQEVGFQQYAARSCRVL